MSLQTSKKAKLFGGVAIAILTVAFATTASAATLTRDLQLGSNNSEVMSLQQMLNMSADTQVSVSGAGSPGNESTYFGAKTKAAVIKYQKKMGITPAAGYVGPKTRAQLNGGSTSSTGSTGSTSSGKPMGTGLTVSVPNQPSASLAPVGASRVPFTKVTLTASNDGDVVVNGVTIQRTGLANDAVFSGVVLLDENGTQMDIAKTLNSNHQAIVGGTFTVKAGTSRTLTVAGNMETSAGGYAGQVATLSVVQVNTSATVNGSASLPITGAANTINETLTLGTAQLAVSSFDPNTSSTKQVGDTNLKFAGIRLTAGSAEKVRLWSVRFNQTGSAGSSDLANVNVYVNGTAYPTTVSADGKYFTAMFGAGIVVDKGLSTDVYIQGDLVGTGSAGRTVKFDIYKNTDVYVTGETYGYGITPSPSSTGSASNSSSEFTTGTPFFDGSLFTVSAGSVTTIAKATSVAAQNIAVNVPNQVLGGYSTDIKGEPISVQSATFTIATSSTGAGQITSVSIYDENGAVVAGPVDATSASGYVNLVFTDTITYPVGQHTYTLKGKLPSGFTNNGTVTISTTPSSWSNITGQVTGNTISFSSIGAFSMNAMTVKAANLAISVSQTPTAQNVVAGATQWTFANYQFDATQSGEDIRFSSLPLTLTYGGASTLNDLTSCQLFDGSTALNTGSNVVNTSSQSATTSAQASTFTLDQSLVVPKGTVKTLALKCNVRSTSNSTASYSWGITSTQIGALTATGVTSSNTVTATGGTAAGQAQTVSTGSLSVTTDSSSPSYAVVAANTTGNIIGALKFHATNDAVNLSRIGLKLTNTASSSASDLIQVTLWDGATQVGTATFVGSNVNSTSTLSSVVTVPKDGDKVITVKADFAQQNVSGSSVGPSVPGHLVAVDVDTNSTNTQGTGVGSGTTVSASGSTATAGVRLFKSFPVFTYSTSGATAINGTNDLLVLNVAANSTGEIQLNKLNFTLATTTVTLASVTLSGPNGNVSSTTNATINTAGTLITSWFDSTSNTSDRVIPAGQSKTFTLRGTVSGLTGSNSGSVSVALKADTSYPSLSGFMTTATALNGGAGSNLVWSPDSTTTVAASGTDWTNGYGLGGCFTTSGLGNDCTARVIAK